MSLKKTKKKIFYIIICNLSETINYRISLNRIKEPLSYSIKMNSLNEIYFWTKIYQRFNFSKTLKIERKKKNYDWVFKEKTWELRKLKKKMR